MKKRYKTMIVINIIAILANTIALVVFEPHFINFLGILVCLLGIALTIRNKRINTKVREEVLLAQRQMRMLAHNLKTPPNLSHMAVPFRLRRMLMGVCPVRFMDEKVLLLHAKDWIARTRHWN